MDIDKFIPIDKSHCIRMTLIDLFKYGKNSTHKFNKGIICDDLMSLNVTVRNWTSTPTNNVVYVGESGTLYRLTQFYAWKNSLPKYFIKAGTLHYRNINSNPSIINLPQSELLKLDNGTSQWASAAVLAGDAERLPNPPNKLRLTYNCIDNHHDSWQPVLDETIHRQARYFVSLIEKTNSEFVPNHSEDFCFAYAFGKITGDEGLKRWPALLSHESNRIDEMEREYERARSGTRIASKDHRVVQALALWGLLHRKTVSFEYPQAVMKSWPLFWNFVQEFKIN